MFDSLSWFFYFFYFSLVSLPSFLGCFLPSHPATFPFIAHTLTTRIEFLQLVLTSHYSCPLIIRSISPFPFSMHYTHHLRYYIRLISFELYHVKHVIDMYLFVCMRQEEMKKKTRVARVNGEKKKKHTYATAQSMRYTY